MTAIGLITSVFAMLLALPICYAYARIACHSSAIVRHMSVSLLCLVLAYPVRASWWDVAPYILGDTWFRAFGPWVAYVNGLWNVLFVYGCVRAIKALQLMIPEGERDKWPIWLAPFYPPVRFLRGRLNR